MQCLCQAGRRKSIVTGVVCSSVCNLIFSFNDCIEMYFKVNSTVWCTYNITDVYGCGTWCAWVGQVYMGGVGVYCIGMGGADVHG